MRMNTKLQMYNYKYFNKNDMKFSGFFEFTKSHKLIDLKKYLIFIEFDNKMYIDVKGLESIIMPYDQFIQNKNEDLKKYYELSLKLMEDKNYIMEKKYNEKVYWFLNCAYIVDDIENNIKQVDKGSYYCYCNINPYILKKMNVSSNDNIEKYFNKLSILLLSYEKNIEVSSCVNCIVENIKILPYIENIITMYKKYIHTSYYDKIEKLVTKYLINSDSDSDSD